jgi:hypothetical protein
MSAGLSDDDKIPDAGSISAEQVRCLSALISRPSLYTQRCVEQLAFFPNGGERWTRTLQIRIPLASRPDARWWPVTLGTFRRRRYPDFTVLDCNSRRLSLLTRRQHGHVLARAIFSTYDATLRAGAPRRKRLGARVTREIGSRREALISLMSDHLTSMQTDEQVSSRSERRISRAFRYYVDRLGVPEAVFDPISFALGVRLVRETETTQYFCWVRARPGEVINLTVSYSALDRVREPKKLIGEKSGVWQTLGIRLMRMFRVFGLAAMSHRVETSGNAAANSYYFTVAPPENTSVVALLSDADGSHSDDGELDSPSKSFHIHNRDDVHGPQPAVVLRAHLLPERREHMTIAAGAVLNILLVFLVARGRFVNGFGAQTWILITPTVLTGVIAQQQRHYYARATRGQRVVLWLYLMVGALFLVAVTFSNSHIPGAQASWGWRAKVTFLVFATFSAFIAVTYTAIGPLYANVTRRLAHRSARINLADHVWIGPDAPARYVRVIFRYCLAVLLSALVCAGVVLGAGIFMWAGGYIKVSSRIDRTAFASVCAPSSTAAQSLAQSLLTSPPLGSTSLCR